MDFNAIHPFVRFVRYLEFRQDTVFPPYCPLDARLFYVFSGEGRIAAENSVLTMPAGSLLYINAGCPYRLLPCSAVYIAVNFDFTCAHSVLETPVAPINLSAATPVTPIEKHSFPDAPYFDSVCFFDDLSSLQGKFLQLAQEFTQKLPYYRQETSAILLSVLTTLARRAELRFSGDNRFDIGQIIKYIQEHSREPLDNQTLADCFHFHPNYISAQFKRSTGKPLHRYVLETRILNAVSLMESGNSSICEIAALTGFHDANYFTRYFKQVMGTTPGKYIRSCIQK